MKKSIFLFFAAILCAIGMNAAGTTPNRLYMKRDWQTDNAWFAAYFFGNGEKWVKMTDLGSGLYTCETPQDKAYTSVIFCRMDGSKQNNLSWGAKWEQTGDLTLSASKDFYKKTSWTTFEPTIAGDGVLLGESWTPGSTANKMTKQNNGTYTLVKEGVTLEKKAYEYKVTDGSWDWSVGKNGNNASLSINPAGKYNVTFTYTPSSNTVSAAATLIYTITASANPATAGTVTGAGTYAKDASVTLEATPNAGYKFVNWTVGGVEKSTDAKYSFTASADVTAVANFELSDPEVPTYAISVSANDDAMGTVTGAGDYTEGSPVTLTATPKAGYRFVNWTVGGEVKSTETTYSFTASEALTIVANFEAIPKYDITVKAVVPEAWTSATIGIHYWGDGISGTSTPVATEKEGNWNKYTIKDVLEGQSVNVIFLNGTSWGSDKSKQTANITGITEDKCFQISAKTLDDEGKCTFTEVDCAADIKPEGDVYTIMGAGELGLSWDLAKTGNDMTKQTDGTYTLVKEGLDLATTGSYEYKVVKNHSWDWSIPTGTENQTLKVDKDGTYTVTFTLSADKKKLTINAVCTAEKEVILDCSVAGTINLVGGTADFTDKLAMTYDEGTKTYSKTFTALAAGNYQMKVVYGSDWLGYDKLTKPVPANVTEGDDKKIKFSLAEAGDVIVTYHATNGIGLTGNFAAPAPEAKKYYVKGTHNEWTADATSEMTLDEEVYKKEVTLAKDVEFKINDGADAWWGKDNLGGKSYNELEGLESGNLKMKEAKTFTIIFKPAEHLITFVGLTEKAPAEPAKCYLMGIGGDWTTGIEMEEDGDQFKLLCQPIAEGEQFKFKYGDTWTTEVENYDANGVAWVETSQGSDQYNITLPAGNYDFYYKKNENKVWIGVCTPATPTPDYTRATTAGKFGTICLPFGSTNFTGAEFFECVGKEEGKVFIGSVTTLVAGTPYIFLANATEVAVYSDGTTAATPGDHNGLHGTFTDDTEVAVGNYILLNNELCQAVTTCWVNANRAYLVMSEVPTEYTKMPGRRYIGMDVEGENEATGFENITNGENTTIKLIENGQLIIIRDGEMYNAMGVKL